MPHTDEYFDTLADQRIKVATVKRMFRVFDFIHAGVTLNVIGNSEDELLKRRAKVQELLLNSEMSRYILIDKELFTQLMNYPEWKIHYEMLKIGEDVVQVVNISKEALDHVIPTNK